MPVGLRMNRKRIDTVESFAMRRALWVATLIGLGLFIAAACSSDESGTSRFGISPEAFNEIVGTDQVLLQQVAEREGSAWIGYVQGDQVIQLENGGLLPLGDFDLNFFVTPFPPNKFDLEVELIVIGRDGRPVDATITAWYDMIAMTHGHSEADVEFLGEGRHRMSVHMSMFGPWAIMTTIESADFNAEVPLVVYVWPKV